MRPGKGKAAAEAALAHAGLAFQQQALPFAHEAFVGQQLIAADGRATVQTELGSYVHKINSQLTGAGVGGHGALQSGSAADGRMFQQS